MLPMVSYKKGASRGGGGVLILFFVLHLFAASCSPNS